MICSADRAAIVAQAKAAIEQGSKSFVLASRLFDRTTRERAWLLYAWCRACDDAVDGQQLGHGAMRPEGGDAALAELRGKTDRALAGESGTDPSFEALRIVASECALDPALIRAHIDGFALDARGWRPVTTDDLLRYCYHVAGTVGCMMAQVMGVAPDQEDTLDRACDLGIAFQLANIARDIADDAQAGRCYLPTEWLSDAGIAPDALLAPQNRPALASLRRRLAALAAAYERSARVGAGHLSFRCRWAVLAAASIYGAIGREAGRQDESLIEKRVVIPRARKIGAVAGALIDSLGTAAACSRDGLWTRPHRSIG